VPESIVEVRIKNNPILYDRQKEVLLHVIEVGQITRNEYMERTGVSASTASRDLSEMVWAGWLKREGRGLYVADEELNPSSDVFGFFHQQHQHHSDVDPDHDCTCYPEENA